MAYNLIEMTKHSHPEFAFLTNCYNESMVKKGKKIPLINHLNNY